MYKEIIFSQLGTCKSNPAIAHQIAITDDDSVKARHGGKMLIFDLLHYSCLNGWSMGNIAASGKNLAMFHRDLFAPATDTRQPLLKPETAKAMKLSMWFQRGHMAPATAK